MILPDFELTTRKNQIWVESGLDSKTNCLDKKHFDSFPYTVEYKFNSRGFRDDEWPLTPEELADSVWCVGDSFTSGIGSPLAHIWPQILKNKSKTNTINVSLDGVSNDWIAKKTVRVLQEIKPKNIVIHWSYLHRTESSDDTLLDEDRRMWVSKDLSIVNEFKNFKKNLLLVESHKDQTCIIHSIIPGSYDFDKNKIWDQIKGDTWPQLPSTLGDFIALDSNCKEDLLNFGLFEMFHLYFEIQDILKHTKYVPEFQKLDLARDGHHYDKITASKLVDEILPLLC